MGRGFGVQAFSGGAKGGSVRGVEVWGLRGLGVGGWEVMRFWGRSAASLPGSKPLRKAYNSCTVGLAPLIVFAFPVLMEINFLFFCAAAVCCSDG